MGHYAGHCAGHHSLRLLLLLESMDTMVETALACFDRFDKANLEESNPVGILRWSNPCSYMIEHGKQVELGIPWPLYPHMESYNKPYLFH